ncbi:imm11 family protein [Microbulbifer taiwanensis]|uniref:Imm11 family protein n=1 Tax=Microbulbifer taiwanensis TaxID=986746 RepID=A0ABW1YL29_9GAMM|nr:DUF1629 domain-containing protein [Microbulbifer taiwanensis]
MIYRIHPNVKEYLHFLVSADEVEAKLGEGCRFHLEKKPKSYLDTWKPLEVEFFNNYDSKPKPQPDISVWNGRLYLSEKAYKVLAEALDGGSEVLPVTCGRERGYLVNVLNSADTVDAINSRLTVRNEWNELVSLGFDDGKVSDFALFRTKQDSYRGIYCSEKVKDLIESSDLSGVVFAVDLADMPA